MNIHSLTHQISPMKNTTNIMEGQGTKTNLVPNKRNFSLVSVIFCAAFVVYVIQYDQTDIHSVRRILSEDIFPSTEEPPEAPTNSCTPRKNIVFLKTHKCASSSIQNIFNRYGYRRGLTFVLPAKGSYIGHPEPFNWSMVPDVRRFGLRYNILTHHCRLNYDEMRRNLPDDVLFITIVRNPVELYESLFSFYSLHRFYKERFDTLGKHQKPPGFYEKRMGGKIGFNQMLFDLGMDDKAFSNSTSVMEYIYFLDSVFDLVMVRERMDESLVLLKELLCWDIDDVIIFHLNARNQRYKKKLSPDLYQRLVKFNSADMTLYKYFSHRLSERITEYGREKMSEAVEELKNRTRMWYDLCVQKQDFQNKVINSKRYFTNRMVMAYVKKKDVNTTCDDLTTQEPIFTEKLVYKQRYMFPRPKPYRSRYRYRMHRWH
ncbi:galactosylceramide sulfotransferase [Trichonephila inaurata madagascariensis]|uniref:Galactosylceramide sulfotransferase n=1 Tax=Trichonephila inaurata madagascariensis TaxID=2747483 RepID=A0A8X6XXD8_9ARAC|nr:galactosylceramide sulfotransferase [Trichonephila inaurata madagascariensis]